MTDLEAYVKSEGRDELVKQVRSKIEATDKLKFFN